MQILECGFQGSLSTTNAMQVTYVPIANPHSCSTPLPIRAAVCEQPDERSLAASLTCLPSDA